MRENEKKFPRLDRYKETALPPWLNTVSQGLINLLRATDSSRHFPDVSVERGADGHFSSKLNEELLISEYVCGASLPDSSIREITSYASDSVNRAKNGQVHIPRYAVLILGAELEKNIRAKARRFGLEIAVAQSGEPRLHVQGLVEAGKVEVVIRFTKKNSEIIVSKGINTLLFNQPNFSQKQRVELE